MLYSTSAPFLMGPCSDKLAIEDMHARLLCMLGVVAMEGLQRLPFIKPLCSRPLIGGLCISQHLCLPGECAVHIVGLTA